ncbi:MAG: DUF4349 domain-containing protein [Actinomycetia bacterium]|nr:DUF4349 domain-containing protein [Actinomycetes bacterium]
MRGSRTAALSTITLTGAAVLLAGCSGSANDSMGAPSNDAASGDTGRVAGESLQDSTAAGDATTAQGAGTKTSSGGLLTDLPTERAVIATAEMTLRSEDVSSTVNAIEVIAKSAGGFVSSRDVSSNPDDPKGTRAVIVVRVPTTKLNAVIDQAQAEGEVVRVTSDAQDVTETVVDVNSRVQSAQASVERIRALLSQATTIGEVVRIESELSRREADLESLQAQQRSLADQTALATLSVTVLAPNAVEPAAQDDTGFVAGLDRGWNALVGVVVVALTTLGVLVPFLVVAALVLGPLAAAWRRRRPSADAGAAAGEAPKEQEREPEPVH